MSTSDRPIRFFPGFQSRTLFFLIAWVLFSCVAPLLFAGKVFQAELLDPEHLHRTVFAVQVMVVVFLLPLLLSSGDVLEEKPLENGDASEPVEGGFRFFRTVSLRRAIRFLLFTLVLVLLGSPFVMIAGTIADASSSSMILGQLQVVGLVIGTGAIWWGAGPANRTWVRYVFLILVCLSLILPVIYVSLTQILDVEHPWLLYLSPLMAAVQIPDVTGVDLRLFQAILISSAGCIIGAILFYVRTNESDSGDVR